MPRDNGDYPEGWYDQMAESASERQTAPADAVNDRPISTPARSADFSRAGLVKTPEAIREGIDRRNEERIPASDPIPRPVPKTVQPKKPKLTVLVSGERAAGKTTLIAIVAQALRNSGHDVKVPDHTPSGTMAIPTIMEQFDVEFVEDEYDAEFNTNAKVPYVFEARIEEFKATNRALLDEIDHQKEEIKLVTQHADLMAIERGFYKDSAEEAERITRELQNEIKRLRSVRPADPATAANMIRRARAMISESVILQQDSQRVSRQIEELQGQKRKLRDEANMRSRKADDLLAQAYGVGPQPEVFDEEEDNEPRRARTLMEQAQAISPSRWTAATDKLAAANAELMGVDADADLDNAGC